MVNTAGTVWPISMAAFVFPYAWFLAQHWMIARFGDEPGTVFLGVALLEFIWTGGDWPYGGFAPFPVALFCYALMYNVIRGVLLWKTKTLEIQQEVTGLPPVFSLTGWWWRLHLAVKFGLYGNLAIVALHTMHFLSRRIPIPEG